MKTKIYGASDDLIEIDGEITDEVGCYGHIRPINISASDGTIATIVYDGEWKIKVKTKGTKFLKIVDSVGDDFDIDHTDDDAKGCTSYSDVLVFDSAIEWIKIGRKTIK